MADEVTKLSPAEEAQFQQWGRDNKIRDLNDKQARYDYRGFWRETKGAAHPPGSELHFPDTYKQHGHPTFSVESKYSSGPNDGGHWQGETYIKQKPKMADQQVNEFITQLSQILERNRQQRAATESELAKSDADRVVTGENPSGKQLNASSGFAQGFKGAISNKENAKDYAKPETSYGGDAGASPYSLNASPSPSARALSPSTTSAGRVGLAQDYARQQELLSSNPYRDDSAGFERDFRDQELMGTNPYRPSPADGVAEEQAKRAAQQAAMARGDASGPLGGAGNQLASIKPDANGVMTMPEDRIEVPRPSMYPTPQQPDMALLDAYQQYQRARGGL